MNPNLLNIFLNAIKSGLLVTVIALYGCGGSSETTDSKDTTSISDSSAKVAKENVEAAIKQIPPPSEIPALLESTGADFEASLVNNPKDADKYVTTNNTSALNLGIYTTDLGYVVIYEKTQNAIDYMQSSKKLTDKLGITSSFDESAVQSFQKNLENKDSLVYIVDGAMKNVDAYLRDNQRTPLAAMVLTGSFVEGLYIATGLLEKYPKDVPAEVKNAVVLKLINVIIKQKATLQEVISSLEVIQRDEKLEEILKGLKEMDAIYTKMNMEEKITQNQGDLIITDKDLAELTAKIKEVRGKIVQ